jgi:hypothetical protein
MIKLQKIKPMTYNIFWRKMIEAGYSLRYYVNGPQSQRVVGFVRYQISLAIKDHIRTSLKRKINHI